MTFDEYQAQTNRTNLYPEEDMLFCIVTGIGSEAGELFGKVNKFYRGDKLDSGLKLLLMYEAGDILWGLSELATYLGVELSDIADMNIKKLAKRAENGLIRGSGDER